MSEVKHLPSPEFDSKWMETLCDVSLIPRSTLASFQSHYQPHSQVNPQPHSKVNTSPTLYSHSVLDIACALVKFSLEGNINTYHNVLPLITTMFFHACCILVPAQSGPDNWSGSSSRQKGEITCSLVSFSHPLLWDVLSHFSLVTCELFPLLCRVQLLVLICGSKEKYRLTRDVHALKSFMKTTRLEH